LEQAKTDLERSVCILYPPVSFLLELKPLNLSFLSLSSGYSSSECK